MNNPTIPKEVVIQALKELAEIARIYEEEDREA